MILLDTNVVSEPMRSPAAPAVLSWLDRHLHECALSSITIFELRAGLAQLPEGRRRDILEDAIERLIQRFKARVYAFDVPAARAAAYLLAHARRRGLGLHQLPNKMPDLQIGGIALAHGLILATRNLSDFMETGLTLIDPWNANE